MTIYGDVRTSIDENSLFYIIDNVRRFPLFWENSSMDNIKIYAAGKEISCVAFKSDDIPNGLKILLSGVKDSVMNILSVIGSVKYSLWEISFDDGATRHKLIQINKKTNKELIQNIADSKNVTYEKHLKNVLKRTNRSKIKIVDKNGHANHGMISNINNSKTTKNTARYQILIPKNHPVHKKYNEKEIRKISFHYVYKGNLYDIESKFIKKVGNLYEFDFINLEPGTIYTGLSTSFDEGKIILPSSSLYVITRDENNNLKTIDDAKLGKPKKTDLPHSKIWTEEMSNLYLGESITKRIYDVIIKKHYEDEHEDEYLALSRIKELYSHYPWLKEENFSEEEKEEKIKHIKSFFDIQK